MSRVKFLVHRLDRIARIVADLYKKYQWPSPAYWYFFHTDNKIKKFESRLYARWLACRWELVNLISNANNLINRSGNWRVIMPSYADLYDGFYDGGIAVEFCDILDTREYNKRIANGDNVWYRVA